MADVAGISAIGKPIHIFATVELFIEESITIKIANMKKVAIEAVNRTQEITRSGKQVFKRFSFLGLLFASASIIEFFTSISRFITKR